MRSVNIRGRNIGEGHPVYIIAEMSANHTGDIEHAKQIIRAAKECGADCIKIQTYKPDTMTIKCENEFFRIKNGPWSGETLYELYGKAYTPWEWHADLKKEAENIGLDFFSTPFDKTAVDFLEDIGIGFYKIASFELVDLPLIEYVASKGKPIILSTGMGSFEEIDDAVKAIKKKGNNDIILLKCSSAYPALHEDINLRTIQHMRKSFNVPVGLSDHSMGSLGAIVAVSLGACVIEKHFCLSRKIKSPDSTFSMEPREFRKMVDDIRTAELAIGKAFYGPSISEKSSFEFRRSIFVVEDIKKGDAFTEENIKVIRPGHGLKPKYLNEILGKCALRDIKRGTPLSMDIICSD